MNPRNQSLKNAALSNQLAAATEKVTELVEGGLSPVDAVVKVAEDMQLSDPAVKLVVYAYNTGAQNAQRQAHVLPLQKIAHVELANQNECLQKLYAKKPKVAEETVSPDYHRFFTRQELENWGRRKDVQEWVSNRKKNQKTV